MNWLPRLPDQTIHVLGRRVWRAAGAVRLMPARASRWRWRSRNSPSSHLSRSGSRTAAVYQTGCERRTVADTACSRGARPREARLTARAGRLLAFIEHACCWSFFQFESLREDLLHEGVEVGLAGTTAKTVSATSTAARATRNAHERIGTRDLIGHSATADTIRRGGRRREFLVAPFWCCRARWTHCGWKTWYQRFL